MKLRVRFSKQGLARFFSHLDLQRTVERTLRRAGLPIAYSQGFNPHPRISYASALATGTSSEGEFMDVELTEEVAPAEFQARANACSPLGLRVEEVRRAPEQGDSLMALINAAAYRLELAGTTEDALREAAAALLERQEVVITKGGKKGPHPVNIRPLLYGLSVEGASSLRAVVATGPQGNLKPEELVTALRAVKAGAELELAQAHRLMLYQRDAATGELREPWDL